MDPENLEFADEPRNCSHRSIKEDCTVQYADLADRTVQYADSPKCAYTYNACYIACNTLFLSFHGNAAIHYVTSIAIVFI